MIIFTLLVFFFVCVCMCGGQDIAEMTADFRKKLAATESQLSAVVRSRLDGVKRARDLIEDNANQISKLHDQFAKMEE